MSTTTIQNVSHIEESIKQILGTSLGERIHQPEFGCDLISYIFDSIDEGMYGLLDYEIRKALDLWEKRIIIQDINFEQLSEDDSTLYVIIDYTVTKYEGYIFSTKVKIV